MTTVAQLQVKISADTTNAEQGLQRVNKGVQDTAKGSDALGKSFGGLGNIATVAIGNLVAGAFTKAAGAALGFFGDAIKSAGDFEAGLNRFASVTGGSLAQAGFNIEDVSKKALKLGADTQFSAAQAEEAMINLAKGGVPVADIMSTATDATLALAAAGELDLAPAADIVAKQLGVWSETGVTAANVSDLLAQAANASTVDVQELAGGLAQAGGSAKVSGVSFQDLVQTMALIAPNFSSASDAGTSLKTFIQRLIPTTDDATSAMYDLGLATKDGKSAFFDAQGSFIGMEQAAKILHGATAGLSEEEKSLAFNTIFGSDAIRAAAAIANAGAPGFDAMGNSMSNAGTAAEQSAEKNKGFNFALETMKGSLETLAIVIGTAILPSLTSFINGLTTAINGIMGFVQAILAAPNPMQEFVSRIYDGVASLLGLSGPAYEYGANIAAQFAEGISSAIAYVQNALEQIGSIISYWLAPGSPPRIVPNLDRYGADAATVYFDGWTQGDYSALQAIGGTIQEVLGGLVSSGVFAEQDVIPKLLGTQGAMQDAITQLRETGSVSQELIDNIINGAGPAGDTIRGFVEAYFDLESATRAVQDAQNELNSAQDEYNAKLAPLNAELDIIQQQKKALQDKQRIEKLQEKIADGKSSDTEKQIALLEIEEIQKRNQLDVAEKEGKVIVDVAKDKLEAAQASEKSAKDALAIQQASIAATNKQNQLIGQQAQILDRIAKQAAADAKPKGGGGGGGAGKIKGGGGGIKLPAGGGANIAKPFTDAMKPITNVMDKVDAVKQHFIDMKMGVLDSMTEVSMAVTSKTSAIGGAFSTLSTIFAPLESVFKTVGETITTVIDKIKQGDIGGAIVAAIGGTGSVTEKMIAFVGGLAMTILQGISDNLPAITQKAIEIGTALIQGLGEAIPGIISTIGAWAMVLLKWAVDNAPAFLASVITLTQALLEALGAALPGIIEALATWGAEFIAWVIAAAPGLLAKLLVLLSDVLNWIMASVPGIAKQLGEWALKFIAWVGPAAADLIIALGGMLAQLVKWIIENAPGILKTLGEWGDAFGKWIIDVAIPALLKSLAELGIKLWDWIKGKAKDIAADGSVGRSLVDGIQKGIAAAWGKFKSWINSKINEIPQAVRDVLGIHSPSTVMVPIGKGILDGIGVGIENAMPALKSLLASVGDVIANSFGGVSIGDSLNLRADFLRMKADALAAIADMPDIVNTIAAQKQLDNAEIRANEIAKTNIGLANEYYALEIQHIKENADIEQKYNGAKNDQERENILALSALLRSTQMAELAEFEKHAKAVNESVMKGVIDRINSFMRDSLSGVAGFARGRAAARKAIQDMFPDTSELQDKLKELREEEALARITAKQNIDPVKREEAEQRLLEIATERAEIEKQLAAQTAQTEIARRAQAALAQAEKEAAEMRKADPKLADEYYDLKSKQILELAQLEQEKANAKSDTERRSIDEQIALVKEAQAAELALFQDDAKKRKEETDQLAKDSVSAAKQFGDAFTKAIQDSLSYLTTGLAAALHIVIPPPAPPPGRASGGPVKRGKAYTVGEEGEEVFVPDTSGRIISNDKLHGNGATTHNHYTIDARGSNWTEDKFREVIEKVVNSKTRVAALRGRTS